jgi:hypothetical protein
MADYKFMTARQMSIAGAYQRALAGRDPEIIVTDDILAAVAVEVPDVTFEDINDALRAEIDRMHHIMEMHLRNAPGSGRPN